MSNINYQALREVAEAAKGGTTWQDLQAFRAAATPEVVLALLDVLDASLEAEPVAWTDEEELRDIKQYGFGEIFQCPPDKYADPRRVIPLYRELPAPVVPEEISTTHTMLPAMNDQLMAFGYVKGWNACRAAMLNGEGE